MTDIFHVNLWINIAIVAAVFSREYHSDEEGFEQAVAIPSLCFVVLSESEASPRSRQATTLIVYYH